MKISLSSKPTSERVYRSATATAQGRHSVCLRALPQERSRNDAVKCAVQHQPEREEPRVGLQVRPRSCYLQGVHLTAFNRGGACGCESAHAHLWSCVQTQICVARPASRLFGKLPGFALAVSGSKLFCPKANLYSECVARHECRSACEPLAVF